MEFQGKVLDPFQVEAARSIDAGESVVVSAPTGSGKTLIAEYAIHTLFTGQRRAIYTAPIKALSNQKYRDFKAVMGDRVGIITGDVVINPTAQVLIMTTEIYRNILFQDIVSLDDVRCVIFDEVHYINDIERGTVWEEAIIFSPPHIRFCFLSATIPNAQQFARWVEALHKHPVRAIEHHERPVPLEHFIYEHTLGLAPWHKLREFPHDSPTTHRLRRGRGGRPIKKYHQASHLDVVTALRDKLPCLFFVFSRAGCEQLAIEAAEHFDFTSASEKAEIKEITDRFLAPLQKLESLQSIERIRDILPRGIALHHAGLLPVLKELVEVLFARGFIRLLYATETFAVGINMPARSVAFHSLRKFDGRSFDYMRLRSYYQMAGRAGRRGMDSIGTVVTLIDMNHFEPKRMPRYNREQAENLLSQFDLSYNSVLNLHIRYRSDEIREVLQNNFSQFQAEDKRHAMQQAKKEILTRIAAMPAVCPHGNPFTDMQKTLELDQSIKHLQRSLKRRRGTSRRRTKAQLQQLQRARKKFPCHRCREKNSCRNDAQERNRLQENVQRYRDQLHCSPQILHFTEFKNKSRLLQILGFIDKRGVTPRGMFASRINGYELLATEFMFGGWFERFEAKELAACACACAYEGRPRTRFSKKLPNILPRKEINKYIRRIRRLEHKFNIFSEINFENRGGALAARWAEGADFLTLCELTSLSEGDIIQLFRRGVDFLRQVRHAAHGHPAFQQKCRDAIDLLYRDIVVVQL